MTGNPSKMSLRPSCLPTNEEGANICFVQPSLLLFHATHPSAYSANLPKAVASAQMSGNSRGTGSIEPLHRVGLRYCVYVL